MRLQGGYVYTDGVWQSYGNATTLKLSASDYIEVWVWVIVSATIKGGGTLYTHFSGHKLY